MTASRTASIDDIAFSFDASSFSSLMASELPRPVEPQVERTSAARTADIVRENAMAGKLDGMVPEVAASPLPTSPTQSGSVVRQRDVEEAGQSRVFTPQESQMEATSELGSSLGETAGSTAESSPTGPAHGPSQPAFVAGDAPQKPVWEVDQLRWPSLSERMLREEDDYFGHAGQKLYEASKQGLGVLAVASRQPGEGCTTLSICLARAAAAAGARVALLDADLRSRALALSLGLELSHGWLDVTPGQIPWTEAAVHSLQDQLTVIPAGPSGDRSRNVTATIGPQVIDGISQHFDLVVLDVGQLDELACQLLGGSHQLVANAAIVVRDFRRTSETDTLDVIAQLKRMGVKAVGIAENFAASLRSAAAA